MLFHVIFEVPLVVVVGQHLSLIEREVALAEGEVVFVLLTHMAHDEGMTRGSVFEGFGGAPLGVGGGTVLHLASLAEGAYACVAGLA